MKFKSYLKSILILKLFCVNFILAYIPSRVIFHNDTVYPDITQPDNLNVMLIEIYKGNIKKITETLYPGAYFLLTENAGHFIEDLRIMIYYISGHVKIAAIYDIEDGKIVPTKIGFEEYTLTDLGLKVSIS